MSTGSSSAILLTVPKNDAQNRKRGMRKLEKALNGGKLNKKHINNKGYNKYLKLEGQLSISIDYEKYQDDAKWDGLKGYLTNTSLAKEEVINQYKQLWNIEKTFRISKSDLRIRPIYHHLKRRIESHICISFAACKIYKELERQLRIRKCSLKCRKSYRHFKNHLSVNHHDTLLKYKTYQIAGKK